MNIKILLTASAACVIASCPPAAADGVDASAGYVQSAPACAATPFAGLYIGGYAAYAENQSTITDVDTWELGGSSVEDSGGFAGGAQIGYDWTRCNTLFGVVADLSVADADSESNYNFSQETYSADMEWMSTFRLRAGAVLDNTLLYVTGGLAVADFDNHVHSNYEGGDYNWDGGGVRYGYVFGAGFEHAFSSRWFLAAEILYADFEDESGSEDFEGDAYSFRFDDEVVIAKIGVNYRFHREHHVEPLK